jgi:hypothetical protein
MILKIFRDFSEPVLQVFVSNGISPYNGFSGDTAITVPSWAFIRSIIHKLLSSDGYISPDIFDLSHQFRWLGG